MEVISTEELPAVVALSGHVHVLQMPDAFFPVLVRNVPVCRSARSKSAPREILAAVATGVCLARMIRALVERTVEALQCRAAPTSTTA